MTLTETSNLDRIENLVRRLENLGFSLDVDPQITSTFPPAVAPGELIESVWGNAVRDRIIVDQGLDLVGLTAAPAAGTHIILSCATSAGPMPFPTVVHINAAVFALNDSVAIRTQVDFQRQSDGAVGGAGADCYSGPNQWIGIPAMFRIDIPANAGGAFHIRGNFQPAAAAGGTFYYRVQCSWFRTLA